MKDGRKKSGASIRDVAQRAGVSISSVSRALNAGSGNVSEETRRRVASAAEQLNYRPNQIGRALRAQTTNTFALILSNIQNNFFAAVSWELERLLSERGSALLLYTSNEDRDIQDRCLEDIRARQVSGVFFLCAVESDRLRETVSSGPVVFINRRIPTLPDVSFVGIDDYTAARELSNVMLRGPSRAGIGIIHGPLSSDTSRRRLDGFLSKFAEAGLAPPPSDIREARLSMQSGYQAAVGLLAARRYGALFCGNDQIAYGAHRRCRELGLRAPEDISIFGFDDNPLNEWLAPWLNTVRVPYMAYASSAVAQMEHLLANGAHKEVVLPYEIVQRA